MAPRAVLDRDHYNLLGTYASPEVGRGTILTCESRDDDVIVVGYTDAQIPWPVGRRRGFSARGPVLYGDLVDAVRRESNQAVCRAFGVTPQTAPRERSEQSEVSLGGGVLHSLLSHNSHPLPPPDLHGAAERGMIIRRTSLLSHLVRRRGGNRDETTSHHC